MTGGTSRWERWARPRVLIAVVVVMILTTVGRCLFNDQLPKEMPARQAW